MPLPLETAEVERLLGSWQVLNEEINDLTLRRCIQLLQQEMGGRRRQSVIYRLHGRINRLRAIAERSLLINGNWPPTLSPHYDDLDQAG